MGIPVRDLLRRKGTPYDELGLDDPALNDDAAARRDDGAPHPHQPAYCRHPTGVKLCRPSETVLDILPNPQRGAFSKEDGEAVVDAAGNRVARPPP